MKRDLKLKLRGKAAVFIDWANVYGWTKTLKQPVNPKNLYKYLNSYTLITQVLFYFGTDRNEKSQKFINRVAKIGYKVTTKPVKYILISEIKSRKLYRRKCDFDMEICIDVHKLLEKGFESFIFFTGDGDFEPLYNLLIKKQKQVIVIYAFGHLGREIYAMKKGIYKKAVNTLTKEVF